MTVVTEETDDQVRDPVFTGPGTPAGRLMRSYWQPVLQSRDLAAGTAQPLTVMSEQYTLYRGEDGVAVVMAPRCAHRLTVLSVGTVEGDSLRCMFHGWKFGPDGRCVEAPGESERLVSRASVTVYPTREAYGLIFAYLGDGEPPKFPGLEGFSRTYGHDLGKATTLDTETYVRRCNFFTNVENGLDHAHVPFTHRLSSDPSKTKTGFSPDAVHQEPIEVERGEKIIRVRERGGKSPYQATFLMPNGLHLIVGIRDGIMEQFAWRVPIDDEQHRSFAIVARYLPGGPAPRAAVADVADWPPADECAELIIRGEKRLVDFVDHPALVNIEDHVAQVGMGRLADRTHEYLAESDKGVVQLRRMWRRELDAFADGAPVRQTW
ncbi:Rieske 2Fe-2S domain-containing protein [Amycolatopsis thermoflava]|uniref:Rieske 2Fe-2S domain-containing protein n=1 Tax=Amycolatopsis thermoflava TaxID=84480 RepID=UPI00041602A1|nr:Rieske 2Fe-2S domain-containing protein [Amycolatopsis thermoflava]